MTRLHGAVSAGTRIFSARLLSFAVALTLGMLVFNPTRALACACGCGLFDVGTASMFPTGTGGFAYLEYEFMNQNQNWSGTHEAPAANNDDKEIKTHFVTAGLNYTFNRNWGVQVQVPYWERYFKTTDEDTGNLVSATHGRIGDVRVTGVYTGFSDDMSTGLRFGLKLPTGSYTAPGFDRDTQIGTGSTDILIGVYHMDRLAIDMRFSWFAQVMLDEPLVGQDHYLPGAEVNGTLGLYYQGWTIGDNVRISPVLQILGSHRAQDRGANSNRPDTGYDRILVSPGLELNVGNYKINADIGVPIYQNITGNQLTPPEYFKLIVGYKF